MYTGCILLNLGLDFRESNLDQCYVQADCMVWCLLYGESWRNCCFFYDTICLMVEDPAFPPVAGVGYVYIATVIARQAYNTFCNFVGVNACSTFSLHTKEAYKIEWGDYFLIILISNTKLIQWIIKENHLSTK